VRPPAPILRLPPLALSSLASLVALFQPPAPTAPAPPPALGDPVQQGWPLSLTGVPVSGVMPPPSDAVGAGLFVLTALPVALLGSVDGSWPVAGPWSEGRQHVMSQAGQRYVYRAAPAVPGGGWLRPGGPARALGLASVAAPVGRPAPGSHQVPADGRPQPRPAPPASAPILAAPPIGSPITGGGPTAAGAGTGGGAAAATLTAAAVLLLLFTLSARVPLETSAWRSTLLSLRLERPG